MSASMQMPCAPSCSGRGCEPTGSRQCFSVPPAFAAPSHSRRGRRSARRSARGYTPAQASAAAFAGDLSSFGSASGGLSYDTMQQLASVLGFAIGAGWFAWQMLQSQVRSGLAHACLGLVMKLRLFISDWQMNDLPLHDLIAFASLCTSAPSTGL